MVLNIKESGGEYGKPSVQIEICPILKNDKKGKVWVISKWYKNGLYKIEFKDMNILFSETYNGNDSLEKKIEEAIEKS